MIRELSKNWVNARLEPAGISVEQFNAAAKDCVAVYQIDAAHPFVAQLEAATPESSQQCSRCFGWGHRRDKCQISDQDVGRILETLRAELQQGGCCGGA